MSRYSGHECRRRRGWLRHLGPVLIASVVVGGGVAAAATSARQVRVSGGATARSDARAARSPQIVKTRNVSGLGTILVNGAGRTLYMFVPDKHKRVTCVQSCAAVWPPLKLAKGQTVVAKGDARKRLLGSDPNPGGGRVATYRGWPLYTFVGDKHPGQATGQAIRLNGGLWYVLTPSGMLIKHKPHKSSSTTGTTTTTTSATSTTTTATTTTGTSTSSGYNCGSSAEWP